MATFATKENYPEANSVLGAGKNPNTHDIDTFRNGACMIHKVLLDDEDIERLKEGRALYLYFVGSGATHAPMKVLTGTPFISAEQQEKELLKDIAEVNSRLRNLNILELVTKETTHAEAMRLNTIAGRDIFAGCEYYKKLIAENLARMIEQMS